jgi:transcriptional regulator with XRE-family HTH domain
MALSERLKEARGALGLKQDEMAEQSGVSGRAYQGYEGGRSVPGGEAIEGFVRAGINANWLLTGEGPMLLADLQAVSAPVSAVDVEVLAYVIEEIERVLQTRRLTLVPAKKAALIQIIYDYCVDTGKRESGTVERFLKLVA